MSQQSNTQFYRMSIPMTFVLFALFSIVAMFFVIFNQPELAQGFAIAAGILTAFGVVLLVLFLCSEAK